MCLGMVDDARISCDVAQALPRPTASGAKDTFATPQDTPHAVGWGGLNANGAIAHCQAGCHRSMQVETLSSDTRLTRNRLWDLVVFVLDVLFECAGL